MEKAVKQPLPRAREAGLVIQELPDEVLVYDQDTHQAHCLNPTARLVWQHCDGETSVAQMVRILEQELPPPVEEAAVWLALDQLAKANLLLEAIPTAEENGVTRRQALRRVGRAAAVAVPLVTSLVAPEAVLADSCKASGSICLSSAECCSGLCSMGFCV